MKLLVVESPEKAKHIRHMLGADWCVEASFGHVRDLPDSELGIELDTFTPHYVATERGAKTLAKLRDRAKDAEAVYLATDPDREGEAIAWHIADALRLKSPHRVTWNEITERAVSAALASPRRIDMALVKAQEARRVIDRLVGYRVSPVLSNACSQRLSAGRVQSVAVRLVVERENEITAFTSTSHFGAELTFGSGTTWSARWDVAPFVTEDVPFVLDRGMAAAVAAVRAVHVTKYEERQSVRRPPAPFISTTLMKAASNALNIAPEATMQAAQLLFDNGLITYHRTDFPNMSEDGIGLAQAWLRENAAAADVADKPHRFPAADGAQEAHEAIRPTNFSIVELDLPDENAKQIYRLIRDRALASVMKDAVYNQRTAHLESDDDIEALGGVRATFKANGRALTYAGWLALLAGDASEEPDDDAEQNNAIPDLSGESSLAAAGGRVLELKTKAPKRYSESSLVDKLERMGIGRPSTYAAILKNIKTREYVELKGKFFKPLPAGCLIVQHLTGRFDFMEYEYTKTLELELDQIAQGKSPYTTAVATVNGALDLNLGALADQATKFPCPVCAKPLRRIKGKDGWFWGCTGYPECKTSLFDRNGEPTPERPNDHPCPLCKSPLIRHKTKEGAGFWWGCSAWKSGCTYKADDKNGKPAKQYDCPECGKALRQREGSRGKFWSCTGYSAGCKFSTDDSRGRPALKSA